MLLVPLTCPTCGAPGRHAEGSLFAWCAHCGAVIARHRDAVEGATMAMRRAYLAFVGPDEPAVRLMELAVAKEAARAAGDRDRFEVLATEALLLEVAGDPRRAPAHVARGGPTALAAWIRSQVALRAISAFDPSIHAGFPQLPVARLEADPAGAAAAYLAALRPWARGVVTHPSFPVELRDELVADTLVTDAFRIALAGAAPMLSSGAITGALSALGARAVDGEGTCAVCGGPYAAEDAAAGACPYCRSAIDAEQEHPWVQGLARIASGPLSVPRPPRDRVVIALQLLTSNIAVSKRTPELRLARAYLRRVTPDVAAPALREAIALVGHGVDALARGFLQQLASGLDGWQPAAAPPRPRPAPPAPPTVDAALEDPWVRAQLVTWAQLGPQAQPAMAALSFVITGLALAAPIAATQIVGFFVRAGVPAPEAIAACELHAPAAEPAAARVLAEAIALLRARA